jgi:C1A family cysteine protease
MEQGFISQPVQKSNKKVVLLALLGVVAIVGCIAVVSRQGAPASGKITLSSNHGVEAFIAEAFGKWQAKFGRMYSTEQEQIYRMKVFRDNFYIVKAITDEGSNDFKVGLNIMADLTREEFIARYISAPMEVPANRNVVILDESNVPDKIDWRDQGAVQHVKDQGFCGSCWAFSATGALEGLRKIKSGDLQDFSEQDLVDCSRSYGNYGCNGGLMTYAFEYTRDNGIAYTKDYPYKGVDGKCKDAPREYKISGYTDVEENNEDQLAAAVAAAPTSVAVQADSSVFQHYTSGVIDSKSCGTSLNHGILAVGYDTTASKSHWICKNSWSAGWGDNGYVRIKKADAGAKKGPGICGIAMMNTYPNA